MGKKVQIGIIGGSGLNSLDFLKDVKSVCKKESNTIYDNILFGYYNHMRVLYIPRHGFFHECSPSRVPYKSMMCALKNLGCTHIIATTAVLSLNSDMKPGDFVIIDSFIDCTENRENTFHREYPCSRDDLLLPTKGSKPFSEGMSRILKIKADSLRIPCHLGGVVITVEGPRFPSPAESGLYANFGADILNFTTVPEKTNETQAKLLTDELFKESLHMKMNIGIIGGTGISHRNIFSTERYIELQTPFGDPSGKIAVGRLGNTRLFFIPRHGWKHTIPPSAINYRANIWALKALGCTHVIGTTASCSLNDNLKPGDLMMLSSFINRTSHRESSFYNGELGVAHIPMQPSFNERLNKLFYYSAQIDSYICHQNGLVVVVEGPRFPTVAESALYHSWGADVISMTTVPEVCLAKELALLYCCIASVSDYCSWNFQRKSLTVESVVKNFQENGIKVTNLIRRTLPWIETESWDEEIKLLEKTVQRSKYRKGVPTWAGPYFPPWIADKIALKRDNNVAAQKPLHTDVCGAFLNEPYLIKSFLPLSISKSNFCIPITSELSNSTGASMSFPLAVTSTPTLTSIQTPRLHQNLHSTDSRSSNSSKYSQYPTKLYSKSSTFHNNSPTKSDFTDTLKSILASHFTPHKPFPEEIEIDILPVPYVIYPPGKLFPPPRYKLRNIVSFIVPEQIHPQEFPVVINIHPPPTVLNLPLCKLHQVQPFILPAIVKKGSSRSILNSQIKGTLRKTKSSESKHSIQLSNLKSKTQPLPTLHDT